MNNLGLSTLEKDVIEWLSAGEDPVIAALQKQFKNITSVRRDFTGYGFYSHFEVPLNLQPIHTEMAVKANFSFGDVEVMTPSLKNGAGFLLWIKNGIISFLEGYTYDEAWPEEIKEYKLRYIPGVLS